MTHSQTEWNDLHAIVRLGSFRPANGVAEFHALIELNVAFVNAETQYQLLEQSVQRLSKLPELNGATLVWKRFFASDAINQVAYMTASVDETVSIVQQPPLNGTKVSVWLYFVENAILTADTDGTIIMKRPHYVHLFNTQLHERSKSGGVEQQTREIFNRYSQCLSRHDCTLERNCIRTWIFIQDVDVQYAGMVSARREYFELEGLTPQTHYIASTGIEGRYIYPDVLVLIDACAISGINPSQVRYLQALTHLNRTSEYGVTFERGTSVDYGDRRHIIISGTASINNRGEIVHPLDVSKQTIRIFENIQALLNEANATMNDIALLIVYLRDTADFATVNRYLDEHYLNIPRLIVLAPVCRPGWLIEVECVAIKPIEDNRFHVF